MNFLINDEKMTLEEVLSLIENELYSNDSYYDDMLDEVYGSIDICGIEYDASLALYRTDKVAYNVGKDEYYDALLADIEYDLERMAEGDSDTFYGIEVICLE